MQDKRRHTRWRLNSPVRVKKAEAENDEMQVMSNDISIGGLSLLSQLRHAPQTELELIIELPDEQRFICTKGRLIWQKEAKTGISFSMIADTDKERIFNYVYRFRRDELMNKWWDGLESKSGYKDSN